MSHSKDKIYQEHRGMDYNMPLETFDFLRNKMNNLESQELEGLSIVLNIVGDRNSVHVFQARLTKRPKYYCPSVVLKVI